MIKSINYNDSINLNQNRNCKNISRNENIADCKNRAYSITRVPIKSISMDDFSSGEKLSFKSAGIAQSEKRQDVLQISAKDFSMGKDVLYAVEKTIGIQAERNIETKEAFAERLQRLGDFKPPKCQQMLSFTATSREKEEYIQACNDLFKAFIETPQDNRKEMVQIAASTLHLDSNNAEKIYDVLNKCSLQHLDKVDPTTAQAFIEISGDAF